MSSAEPMPEERAVCMSYPISVIRGLRFLLFCSFVVTYVEWVRLFSDYSTRNWGKKVDFSFASFSMALYANPNPH